MFYYTLKRNLAISLNHFVFWLFNDHCWIWNLKLKLDIQKVWNSVLISDERMTNFLPLISNCTSFCIFPNSFLATHVYVPALFFWATGISKVPLSWKTYSFPRKMLPFTPLNLYIRSNIISQHHSKFCMAFLSIKYKPRPATLENRDRSTQRNLNLTL